MKLYEITEDYQKFIDAVESGEIPEEAIPDTLESITLMLEEKADNIACIIKNFEAEAEAIKAEKDKLTAREKAKRSQIEKLKSYLSNELLKVGCENIETARNKISFRKSESVEFDNEAAFIKWAMVNNDELINYQDPTVNKTAIKKALADGAKITGARIKSNLNIQIN